MPTSRPPPEAALERQRTLVLGEPIASVKTSDALDAGCRERAALIVGEDGVRLKDEHECGRHRNAEAGDSGGDVRPT